MRDGAESQDICGALEGQAGLKLWCTMHRLQAFADQQSSFLAVLVGGAKDNNYRNMMRRDLENKGEEYVRKTYPARAKYCIPILVDPADAPCRRWWVESLAWGAGDKRINILRTTMKQFWSQSFWKGRRWGEVSLDMAQFEQSHFLGTHAIFTYLIIFSLYIF